MARTRSTGLDGISRRPYFTGPGDYVFATVHGTMLDDGEMREAIERAGISRDRATGKPFVFHDLRHPFGTLAVQAFPLSDAKAHGARRRAQDHGVRPPHAAA